ncbi:hypothetical protein [Comamonas sp. JC664]|uniref:hypothetical protein n=1 Tax=Comamonas sp. JC664 TaxID=2801917 RepID=UPI00174BED10|nr:hypothetical protein [Comamonas sp. JC664]MBL0694895.1 hypothetical protein [Comamonas sp. JC664]GHG95123.1 hypothetical protein GCM10012319_58720 [Comamonas sp. KCTC 72670]
MSSFRRHLSLLSAVLLVAACGGAEEPFSEEDPTPGLESSDVGGDVEAFSACTVTLACTGGSSIQCSSTVGSCSSTSTSVTCDGETQACPPTSCAAPLTRTIRQGIGACYPARHPFGRYYIDAPESDVTYTWTSNYANLHWTTGSNMNLSATSVGWFTLYVTASRPGCTQTTSFWADFYADDCGF